MTPPKVPGPPPFDTAAASIPPLLRAIGAEMIGYCNPSNSASLVLIMSGAPNVCGLVVKPDSGS